MKRALSFGDRESALVLAGTGLIAATYGLVRLAYGLFLPDIRASVPLGTAVAGYVSTGASVAYCAGALVGIAVPTRPRLLVVGAIATAAIGAAGMALAPGVALLVPATVLASAGAGLASPGLVGIVARNLPAGRVDPAQARVNAGTGPGLVAAGLLALLLTQWRLGFVVAAVVTVGTGLAVLLLDRPAAPAARPARSRPDAALVVPGLGAVLLGTASAVVWTYGRAHLVDAGAGETASVAAWIAVGVGGTATVLTARALSRRSARAAWAATTAVTAVAIAALGVAADLLAVAVLACGLFGWGFVAASSALIARATERAPGSAASGTSVLFVALVLGQAVGSSAAGALAGGIGLGTTFLLAAVVCGLAAATATA